MKKVRDDAIAALKQASERMKIAHDKRARKAGNYSKGDKVYVEATNLPTTRPSRKLDSKRHGPFEVIKKIGESSYKLKLPRHWPPIEDVFNEKYLSPYTPPQFPNQQPPPPPPPIDVEGEPEYNVEEIRDTRRRRGKLQYLVHWEGYQREDDTWEPIENLKNTQKLVQEFHDKNPDRPGPTNNVRAISAHREQELEELAKHPRLFHYIYGETGKGFRKPEPTTNLDVIIPLTVVLATLVNYSTVTAVNQRCTNHSNCCGP
jgi:hypothetical protein